MKHFKKFDKFGENFSFNYHGYDKYSTRVGGFVFLIFIAISLIFFIFNFIPFYKNKNFTLQFFTINVESNNEEIDVIDLKDSFAFGLDCENISVTYDAYKYFDVNIKHKIKIDGIENDESENSEDYYNCDSNDDVSNFSNLKIHDLNFSDFFCLKNFKEIGGIYTDKIFKYYKITVEAKNLNDKEEINNILDKNECNLQFFFKDYIINISNYKNPVRPILNSLFLRLNSDFNIKKNVYFMNYNFKDNNNYLTNYFDFDDNIDKNYTLYSRIEDYFVYKGKNMNDTKDKKKFATLYIRADNRKTEINRKYQNFLDFYAENTSFWIGIFEFLNIFFTIYNGFHANLSMSKKLFFFDIKKGEIIRKNSISSNKPLIKQTTINSINYTITGKNLNEKTIINNDNNDNNIDNNNNNNNKNISVYSQKQYNNFIIPFEKSLSSVPNISKKSTIQIENDENKNENENYISLYEVIKISFLTFCECCEKKIKLKYKEKIVKEAMDIFDKKLDIYIYTKNMILIDIMYQILMSDINKDYINFLSRSLIYLDKNIKEVSKELDAIYKPSSKLNSDYSNKLFKKFTKLVEKEETTEIENKIISLYMKKN